MQYCTGKNGHLIVANAVAEFFTNTPIPFMTEALALLDTNILTYGLNIYSIVACNGRLARRVSLEALKVLRLPRVSGDPV